MAVSTCIKCGHGKFELAPHKPKNCAHDMYLVQCSKCGGVIGIQEWEHTGTLLRKLAKALKVLL